MCVSLYTVILTLKLHKNSELMIIILVIYHSALISCFENTYC